MVAKRLSPEDAEFVSWAVPNSHDGAFKAFFRQEGDGIKVKICHVATTIDNIGRARGADGQAKLEFWQQELSMYTVVVCFIHRWQVGILEEYFDASGFFIFNGELSDFTFHPKGDGETYMRMTTPRDIAMGDQEETATTRCQAASASALQAPLPPFAE